MSRPVVNPGRLFWSGEHWINYLRIPGQESDSGMVSLYHTRYSTAGEGAVAFVRIPGLCPEGLYTDNLEIADFIRSIMIQGRGGPFDRDMPVIEARLRRTGDVRFAPGWVIESDEVHIEAIWKELGPAVVTEGPAPTFNPYFDFFTLLFFAQEAQIICNGTQVQGAPYLRDIWKKSIGGDRSSCVFALAETMTRLPAA